MKSLLFLIAIFFTTLSFSQNAAFRFASLTSNEIEKVKEYPDFDFNADELRNLPVADLLSIYLEEYLDIEKVNGNGKMTTLLSLQIDDKGILKKVTATGANNSFNHEAVKVFQKFEGRPIHFNQLKDVDMEVLIPITLEI